MFLEAFFYLYKTDVERKKKGLLLCRALCVYMMILYLQYTLI